MLEFGHLNVKSVKLIRRNMYQVNQLHLLQRDIHFECESCILPVKSKITEL